MDMLATTSHPELFVKMAFCTVTQENCLGYIKHAGYDVRIILHYFFNCLISSTSSLLIHFHSKFHFHVVV